MADSKISGMAAASALTGAEVLPVVQSAANVKATTQQVVDAAMTTGLTRQALGSINTDTTIDWSLGSYATATITGALTFTFSNPAASGKACVAYLQLTNGGSAVITWPGSVTWSGGTAPTLRASGVDLLRFYTQDGGTTWFGTSENDEPDTANSPGGSSGQLQYNNASAFDGSPLWREDANTITQRNGTSAQAGRWANTWTDASNYELGRVQWASNVFTIGTIKAGTGSARAVAIQTGGITAISIDTSQIVSIGALYISGGSYGLKGNGSNPLYNFRHSPAATTLTSYTLTAGDSGVFYIANSGSDQTFTMPASPSAGTWYGFKVSTSKSSYLRFTANTGQKIRLAGGLSASAGYVRSNTGGSFVYLMYDSTDAEWVAWQQGGTWTIDS